VLSHVECLLKSENYVAAAHLDPSTEGLADYLKMAALWRARATHLRTGGRTCLINEPAEPIEPDYLWS
jgi:hypothetical protein